MLGSVARSHGPGGVENGVVPGRNPWFQVAPPSVEVAQPLLEEPPPAKNRPVWNTDTMVRPKANVSGSTWVLCWLLGFVYGSSLIWMGAASAGAATTTPATRANTVATVNRANPRFTTGSPSLHV